MKTIQTMVQQLTDPEMILRELRETLIRIDPEFPDIEGKYLAAVSNLEKELGNSMTPSVSEFLAAQEAVLAAEMIYIGWQGFQLNLDIFNAPIHELTLRGDRTRLYRENRLGALPMAQKPGETVLAFRKQLREKYADEPALTDDITDFYSYLQTTGYRLVHYFGFRLADQLLPYVIPGYISDPVNTVYYRNGLKKELNLDLDSLDK